MSTEFVQGWLFLSAAVEIGFALLIRLRLRTTAGPLFVLNYLISGYWCALFALDLGTADLQQKLLYQHLRYLIVPFSSVVLLEACYRHTTGRPLLFGWRLALALAIPVSTVVLSLAGPGFTIHPLTRHHFRVVTGALGPVLGFDRGPLGHAAFYYEHLLVALTVFLLVRSRSDTRWERSSRWTMAVVMFSGNVTWALYYFGITGPWGALVSPAIFPFFRGLMTWAILRGNVFDLAPVARASLIESLPNLLIVVGRDGRVVDANRAAREVLRFDLRRAYRRRFESMPEIWAEILACWRSGESRAEIVRGETHYSVSILPVHGAGGEVARIVEVRDITARKQRERELVQARERAEAAHEALRHFIAITAHEIRNPMNGVLGFAQLLRETRLDANQREYTDCVAHYGESIIVVLDDLLDYSKLHAERMELVETDFDLGELCHGIGRKLGPLAQRKGISLRVEFGAELPSILRGDSVRVGQIVTNLAGNAIKFTARGEVVFRIRATLAAPGWFRIALEVSDTGIGIAESALSGLFQPYVQAAPQIQRTHGGTGLGLSIVRGLCELMQGSVAATSVVGQGSTFTATIMLREVEPGSRGGTHGDRAV